MKGLEEHDTWVIYDQFHWLRPDHIKRVVVGSKEEALEQYKFYSDCYPGESLGLTTMKEFKKKRESLI